MRKGSDARSFGMRPLRRCHSAAAVLMAPGAVNGVLSRLGECVTVTTMLRGATTTKVRGRNRGLQRGREQCPGEREQQQKSGGLTLHVLCESSPNIDASIEHTAEGRKITFKKFTSRRQIASRRTAKFPTFEFAEQRAKKPSARVRGTVSLLGIQVRPLILAHHQRTPTNRKRQSLKNSGGLPSKAWPTN